MVLLQIYFNVSADKADDFESMYGDVYVPALRKQLGYQRSRCLRLYAAQFTQEIGAAPTEFNYQIMLTFDTEEHRRLWAASAEHAIAWPQAVGLAHNVTWRGYDIAGHDDAV